ncbi:MAG TPA: HAMP domain-containing sensor histidine kinase [Pyrinomonadaceae bacterium]|nr:HAMP domain-containing sensor histidine kinase [Pyrinomonadaceae bacterium]
MKHSWFPILIVAVLLGLLGLLATWQYQWLGQVSDGERERLQRLVRSDTMRFAEDFNREIRNAYFNFQINAEIFRAQNWNEFNRPLAFWREKTAYPDLIRDFYFAETGAGGEQQNLLKYNRETGAFEAAAWTEELNSLKPKLIDERTFEPVNTEIPALLMPVHDAEKTVDRFVLGAEKLQARTSVAQLEFPKRYGVLIIRLDENVIKNQILPDLVKKYFSASESADYKLAVVGDSGKDSGGQKPIVFQTGDAGAPDASAGLFDLAPDNFIFFANRELLSKREGERKKRGEVVLKKFEAKTSKQVVVTRRNESNSGSSRDSSGGGIREEVEVLSAQSTPQERIRVMERRGDAADTAGGWTLNVQHNAGSLEQFVTRTRQKNLAISFGILSLLAVSVVLIFLSAQRAQRLARRQLDFVSSVSHEFRTPLAVIYSAGENLADGVARESAQVARYGNLIKGEGRKLRAMVEQILDFAGGSSGKRKYDFREARVGEIVENALVQCQPLIDEKRIVVEKEIAENLPPVVADKNALSQALENLIGNAVKYSNGDGKRVKISAKNGGGKIKIAVEDNGIGISAKDLKHVLEPFYRAKAVVDEQIHGNGLGLSLVKQIVDAHKGEIKIESEPEKGSRFTIELPQSNL